jgi:single-strand DNA-binding protein
MSFAKVTIVGNLGRDPEVRYTPQGTLNVQFSMAADGRPNKDGEKNTTWYRVTAWDKHAERLVAMQERGYIGKGRSLYVEGQLEQRTYQDAGGNEKTSLDVTMTDWQFVGGGQQNQQQPQSNGEQPQNNMAESPF